MSGMFAFCPSLVSLDIDHFSMLRVTDASMMFDSCTNLASLKLATWANSLVNTSYMFANCSSLTTIDITLIDNRSGNLQDTSYMFSGCTSLTTIYVSHASSTVLSTGVTSYFWDMDSVTESTDMFKDCTNLVGQNGTTYNASYVDKTYARVDETGTPGYMTWIN
jgi:hypothetical protein